MSNAMKYRRQRMEVKISGEADLLVSVEDDGIGIPLEDQGVIFERFVRLNNQKTAYLPGFGLGLTGVEPGGDHREERFPWRVKKEWEHDLWFEFLRFDLPETTGGASWRNPFWMERRIFGCR